MEISFSRELRTINKRKHEALAKAAAELRSTLKELSSAIVSLQNYINYMTEYLRKGKTTNCVDQDDPKELYFYKCRNQH